jgi:regulator of PEP synthase PpsR (kinase-PPPase family)
MQHIFLLSDSTGETVERVVRAALSQFKDVDYQLHLQNRLRTRQYVQRALDEALEVKGIVVYTLVDSALSQMVRTWGEEHEVITLDLITPLLFKLSEFLLVAPRQEPGLLHQLDADYYRRIEAVNFTVQHDDGQGVNAIFKSDIILVGISRTSKTPLSMYLAHRGYKTANVPLVMGIEPPAELKQVDQKKIVGLLIDPNRLIELRRERLRSMGQSERSTYCDYERVEEEMTFCRRLYRANPEWLVIDVTRKSVEESASEILRKRSLNPGSY